MITLYFEQKVQCEIVPTPQKVFVAEGLKESHSMWYLSPEFCRNLYCSLSMYFSLYFCNELLCIILLFFSVSYKNNCLYF